MPLGRSAALRRTMATTDLVEALAARRAAGGADGGRGHLLDHHRRAAAARAGARRRSASTASRPSTGPAPGGAWQRRRERTVLERRRPAAALERAGRRPAGHESLVLPPPDRHRGAGRGRPRRSWPTPANPDKRGLDVLCAAWERAPPRGRRAGHRRPGPRRGPRAGWPSWAAPSPRACSGWARSSAPRWLALVAGARAFLSAARIEDWGMAQMEALAAGHAAGLRARAGRLTRRCRWRGELAPGAGRARAHRPRRWAGRCAPRWRWTGPRASATRGARAGCWSPTRTRRCARRVAEELLPRLLASSGVDLAPALARRRRRSSARGRGAAMAAESKSRAGGASGSPPPARRRRPGSTSTPSSSSEHLGHAAHAGGHRGQAAGHRLDQHHRQVLGQAGQHEQVGLAHQRAPPRSLGCSPRKRHPVLEPQLAHPRLQLGAQLAVARRCPASRPRAARPAPRAGSAWPFFSASAATFSSRSGRSAAAARRLERVGVHGVGHHHEVRLRARSRAACPASSWLTGRHHVGALEGEPRQPALAAGDQPAAEAGVVLGHGHRAPATGARAASAGQRGRVHVGVHHVGPPALAAQAAHGGEHADQLAHQRQRPQAGAGGSARAARAGRPRPRR